MKLAFYSDIHLEFLNGIDLTLKHYELQRRIYQGFEVFRLLSLSDVDIGVEYRPFTMFMEGMVHEGRSSTTINSYSYQLARFLDYICEGEIQSNGMDSNILRQLTIGYHSYLVFGEQAENETIRKIAQVLSLRRIQPSTSALYHVPVKQFIEQSDEYHSNLMDLVDVGLLESSSLNIETLFYSGNTSANLPVKQQLAINQYSVIAAVTHGGARMKTKTLFRHVPSVSANDEDYKHFPLDKIPLVIKQATSQRNATLWSLIAATGLRPSEALQLLWEDINFDTSEVSAVDPKNRKNAAVAYKGLTELEINKLRWKSRKTKHTLMLEPYAALFFEHLKNYIESEEYIAHGRHNFVFQTSEGDPLFLSDYGSVILEPFKSASRRVAKLEVEKNAKVKNYSTQFDKCGILGLHSLRHSLCVFLKNYAKKPDGTIGLTNSQIMLLTGHSDIRSVTKYAKIEIEQLQLMLAHANYSVFCDGIKSTDEYRLEYLERQIDKLKEKMMIEEQKS